MMAQWHYGRTHVKSQVTLFSIISIYLQVLALSYAYLFVLLCRGVHRFHVFIKHDLLKILHKKYDESRMSCLEWEKNFL